MTPPRATFLALLASSAMALAEDAAKHVSFDALADGTPAGFTTALTGGGGAVEWIVRPDPLTPGVRCRGARCVWAGA